MQAVLLAAGNSSRFSQFTKSGHKSLITLVGKPLIVHTLLSFKNAGITDVVIVEDETGTVREVIEHAKLDLSIQYITHKGAQGMGAALLEAKDMLQDEFFLINPYHVNFSLFADTLRKKKQTNQEIVLLGKRSINPGTYGLLQVNGDSVRGLLEKPEGVQEGVRVVGMYLLNKEFITLLKETPLEHYHLEKAIDAYAKKGFVKVAITEEETLSLKYPWDILRIKNYLLSQMDSYISPNAQIAENVQISGTVYIEDGVQIMEGVTIKGPCFLGKHVFVGNNAVLRNGVSVEEGALVGSFIEMKNTVVLEKSTTHTGLLEDSVIGKNCKIAAGVLTANVRLDRKNIQVVVKDEKIDSGYTVLGFILGDGSKLGARVTTMPGVIIGKNSLIGPSTTVMKNVPNNTKYYSVFSEYKESNNE